MAYSRYALTGCVGLFVVGLIGGWVANENLASNREVTRQSCLDALQDADTILNAAAQTLSFVSNNLPDDKSAPSDLSASTAESYKKNRTACRSGAASP